jgi:hypothetical protein
LGSGAVEARQPLDCDAVAHNAIIARAIMVGAAPDFGGQLIETIEVREDESWDCGGYQCWGQTHFDGDGAHVQLGHSMWSLVHELNHVFLDYKTGDLDAMHLHWDASGARARDIKYQKTFVPLPP